MCVSCEKKAARTLGMDIAKEDCGGFVFISTHFSLEKGDLGERLEEFCWGKGPFKVLKKKHIQYIFIFGCVVCVVTRWCNDPLNNP